MNDDPAYGTQVRVSNCDGSDFADGKWTCSVGEAAKRFTDEEVYDGTAERWIFSVIDFIRSGGKP